MTQSTKTKAKRKRYTVGQIVEAVIGLIAVSIIAVGYYFKLVAMP